MKGNSTAKKITKILLVMLVCLMAVLPAQAAQKKMKLNKTKANVVVGKTVKLKVSGTKEKIKWSTSNKKVATVKKGVVTAKKAGKATITAKAGGKKVTCKITVKNPAKLNKTNVTINVNSSVLLTVTGVKGKTVWKSSNTKVATVNNGKVQGKGQGSATISATVYGKTLKCKVTVQKAATPTPAPAPSAPAQTGSNSIVFQNTNAPLELYNSVSVFVDRVYYQGNSLVAECYVINGYDHSVYNINVKRLKLMDASNKIIADASLFGIILNGGSLGPHSYVKWKFIFGEGSYLPNLGTLNAIKWDASIDNYY